MDIFGEVELDNCQNLSDIGVVKTDPISYKVFYRQNSSEELVASFTVYGDKVQGNLEGESLNNGDYELFVEKSLEKLGLEHLELAEQVNDYARY